MFSQKLAFLDVETSGSRLIDSKVIEVGILVVDGGNVIQTISTLVNPERDIDQFITGMTGIQNNELKQAPKFGELVDRIYNAIDGAVIVAHNANFDYSFLKHELKLCNRELTNSYACSVKLSRQLYPTERHHNLDAVINRHNLVCKNRHRALDDAMVIYDFFKVIQDSFDKLSLSKAFKKSMTLVDSNIQRQIFA